MLLMIQVVLLMFLYYSCSIEFSFKSKEQVYYKDSNTILFKKANE